MLAGQQIKFIEVDKVTKSMYSAYKSSVKKVPIGGFDEFISLYKKVYDGKMAKIVKKSYLYNENNNYYCNILINDEEREVFLELIKCFTDVKNHVILNESLFTL